MTQKKKVSTALWFLPLVAIILAALFTGFGVLALKWWKAHHQPPRTLAVQQAAPPVVPGPDVSDADYWIDDTPPLPPEVLEQLAQQEELQARAAAQTATEPTPVAQAEAVDACPPKTSVPPKRKKPTRKHFSTPFEKGLYACRKGGVFPCAWEEQQSGFYKQYWLMTDEGPIERGVYDKQGHLVSETLADLSGQVIAYTTPQAKWYFEEGQLVKIRTNPYENCNFYDWFFIDVQGKQDVCQCVYTSGESCCARSPYTGTYRYCEMFPSDKDFCK